MRIVLAVVIAGLTLAGGCQSGTPIKERLTPSPMAAYAGSHFHLASKILKRDVKIYVSLPENYASNRNYPTVYLTDGDATFPMLAPTHMFLTYDEPVPPAIIVGIGYGTFGVGNFRGVDFRPPPATSPDAEAKAFERFLAEELIPTIERRYRSDAQRRILLGQSRGASFVIYSAMADSDRFWGRIASNPALDDGREIFFGTPKDASVQGLRLFVASGSRDRPQLRSDALAWFAHWKDQAAKPWELETVTIENGTHAASLGEVYRRGLLWLFRDQPKGDR